MRKANICLTNEQHSSFRKLLRCLLLLIDMRNGSPKKLRSGKCIFFFYFNSTVLGKLICNFDYASLGILGDMKLQFWSFCMFWISILEEIPHSEVLKMLKFSISDTQLRFHGKSNLEIAEGRKLQFWSFHRPLILIFEKIPHLKVTNITKILLLHLDKVKIVN